MSRKSFEEFLSAQGSEPAPDVKKELNEWMSFLDDFFGRVNTYLKPYVDAKTVKIEPGKVQIFEDLIGPYPAPKMTIFMGSKIATLVPIGTYLIGSKGRVDLKGPRGTVRFVLVDKNSSGPRVTVTIRGANDPVPPAPPLPKIEWEWRIASAAPNIRYIELNEDSFFDTLLETVNG